MLKFKNISKGNIYLVGLEKKMFTPLWQKKNEETSPTSSPRNCHNSVLRADLDEGLRRQEATAS